MGRIMLPPGRSRQHQRLEQTLNRQSTLATGLTLGCLGTMAATASSRVMMRPDTGEQSADASRSVTQILLDTLGRENKAQNIPERTTPTQNCRTARVASPIILHT
jgi:hypothetical protein